MDLPELQEEVPPPEATEPETEAAAPGESPAGWLASRGRRFKLVLFGTAGCLLLAGIALGIWGAVGLYQEKKAAQAREKAAQALAEAVPRIVFRDFSVPLQDGNGYRVLLISFVAEMGNKKKQADLNSNAGVRRQVLNAIRMRGADLVTSAEERELLKQDLVVLINQILGEGAVTNVYLTEFTLI